MALGEQFYIQWHTLLMCLALIIGQFDSSLGNAHEIPKSAMFPSLDSDAAYVKCMPKIAEIGLDDLSAFIRMVRWARETTSSSGRQCLLDGEADE